MFHLKDTRGSHTTLAIPGIGNLIIEPKGTSVDMEDSFRPIVSQYLQDFGLVLVEGSSKAQAKAPAPAKTQAVPVVEAPVAKEPEVPVPAPEIKDAPKVEIPKAVVEKPAGDQPAAAPQMRQRRTTKTKD